MADIRVPTLGESVTEATVGKWFKRPGDAVAVDEPLVELETDKVTLEVPAPAAGVLSDIAVKDGDTVAVGAVLGQIKEGAGASPKPPSATVTKPAASPTGTPNEKTATTKPIGAGPEQPQPREMPMPPSVAQNGCGEWRRFHKNCRQRFAWPSHQRRHAQRDRTRGGHAQLRCQPPYRCARRRPPMMPPAKSACT